MRFFSNRPAASQHAASQPAETKAERFRKNYETAARQTRIANRQVKEARASGDLVRVLECQDAARQAQADADRWERQL